MARKTVLVSDLTGKEGDEQDFVSVIVRQHPHIDQPKMLDALASEVTDLRSVKDLVVVEVKNGETDEFVMTLAEFRKLCPDDVVKAAAGTRGRRAGFSPSAKS